MTETGATIFAILIVITPIIIIIKKIVRKHKENVVLNAEYKKAKQEQKKDSE